MEIDDRKFAAIIERYGRQVAEGEFILAVPLKEWARMPSDQVVISCDGAVVNGDWPPGTPLVAYSTCRLQTLLGESPPEEHGDRRSSDDGS